MKPDDEDISPKNKDPFDFDVAGMDLHPTLSPEIDTDKRRYIRRNRHPTRREVDAVLQRLKSNEGLWNKLQDADVNLSELSHLIALNLYLKDTLHSAKKQLKQIRKSIKDKKRKAKAVEEKGLKSSHKKPRKDSKMATEPDRKKEFSKIVIKEVFAKEALGIGRKGAYYLDSFLSEAYSLLKTSSSATDEPYSLLAALVNRFDLHGENVCKNRTDSNRRGQRGFLVLHKSGEQRGCQMFKEEKGGCTLDNILCCPWHYETRKAVFEFLERLGHTQPSVAHRKYRPSDK